MDGTSIRRMMVAGLAMTLSTGAYQDRAERSAAMRRDDAQFSQRIRGPEESRRICAVDRLAESRLPRTTCRTAREWRERQFHGMRKE
jgi:hypothetical protein